MMIHIQIAIVKIIEMNIMQQQKIIKEILKLNLKPNSISFKK